MEGDWVPERDDEGFADGDSPDDDTMETNLAAEGEDELLNGPRATVYYAVPLSPTEVEEQGKDFTKEEVDEMMKSEPYQKKIATCHLCKQCWYEEKSTRGCVECGGYGLKRPCVICDGQCSRIWHRNVQQTHALHRAQWEGKCGLPSGVQQSKQQRKSEKSISQGMQDLSTR